jgi:hypothetical protein
VRCGDTFGAGAGGDGAGVGSNGGLGVGAWARVPVGRAAWKQQCPGCETRRRRLEVPREEPAVWYDTVLRDWVVRLPVDEHGEAAMLPLEIGWFDTPLAAVYRAAADVVYCAEELDGVRLRRRTDGAA